MIWVVTFQPPDHMPSNGTMCATRRRISRPNKSVFRTISLSLTVLLPSRLAPALCRRNPAALPSHMPPAALLVQNSSGFLSVEKLPELTSDCLYFTTPRLRRGGIFKRRPNQWKGVKVYDLKKLTLEDTFTSGGGHYRAIYPSEVRFKPSI